MELHNQRGLPRVLGGGIGQEHKASSQMVLCYGSKSISHPVHRHSAKVQFKDIFSILHGSTINTKIREVLLLHFSHLYDSSEFVEYIRDGLFNFLRGHVADIARSEVILADVEGVQSLREVCLWWQEIFVCSACARPDLDRKSVV